MKHYEWPCVVEIVGDYLAENRSKNPRNNESSSKSEFFLLREENPEPKHNECDHINEILGGIRDNDIHAYQ